MAQSADWMLWPPSAAHKKGRRTSIQFHKVCAFQRYAYIPCLACGEARLLSHLASFSFTSL